MCQEYGFRVPNILGRQRREQQLQPRSSRSFTKNKNIRSDEYDFLNFRFKRM